VDLSVIVVSYNVEGLLRRCLESIYRDLAPSALEFELLVVDNASTDGSGEMVRACFPQARLLQNQTNRGFAAAVNQALALGQGRFFLLLNPDTEVLDQAPTKLLAFLQANPQAGMVSGQLLNPDGSFQHGVFRFPTLWMSFFDFFPLNHRLLNSRLNGRYALGQQEPFEIDHPLGACMMVRREAVESVGPLDEGFYIYCEEIDWCMRLRKGGWRIYCQPQARIVHYGGQSTRQAAPAMFVELHRSRMRLFQKHYSPLFLWAHRRIVRLGVRRQMARLGRRFREGAISRDERDAWLLAYRQVLEM
jgi:hypothetical protein